MGRPLKFPLTISHRRMPAIVSYPICYHPRPIDAANQNKLVCLAIRYDTDEDVQLFMELWSDGVFFINENAVDLWFSPTTKEDLFEKVSDAVISQT